MLGMERVDTRAEIKSLIEGKPTQAVPQAIVDQAFKEGGLFLSRKNMLYQVQLMREKGALLVRCIEVCPNNPTDVDTTYKMCWNLAYRCELVGDKVRVWRSLNRPNERRDNCETSERNLERAPIFLQALLEGKLANETSKQIVEKRFEEYPFTFGDPERPTPKSNKNLYIAVALALVSVGLLAAWRQYVRQ